ncbi:hypothetical protein Kuja_0050 [Vibrio phage vB_VchM_Kuja]|uniref:Sliding clamp DNA polymerase accessory protein n=1 Tax=Vibrio phage vB_VchM_Kuja TaxID=2686437 RepID=A0A6B9JAN2_9CAUD|nr:hypothetical protein HWC83_gp005 [Vibrio phage vB_VchM_Kuja]QGZ15996.1 hypothetical protein Kuja_0050 [Vibrio phage vB_VchM_Kuja]
MSTNQASVSVVLSKTTRQIMSNFSKISASMILQPGKILRVADMETGTVFARSKIEEEFPFDFPIVDISQLLSVMDLTTMKDCSLKFVPETNETQAHILLQGSGVSVRFVASSSMLVQLPEVEPEVEDNSPDIIFEAPISHQALTDFKSACRTLGLTHCLLKNENGRAYVVGQDPTTDASNDYVLDLGETKLDDCELYILLSSIKFIESDYIFRATSAFLLGMTPNKKIEYFVSAEQM